MYNPIEVILEKTSSTGKIRATTDLTIEGINAIADVFYCADLSGIDKHSLSGLGAALLALNGIVNTSIEKMEKTTNE